MEPAVIPADSAIAVKRQRRSGLLEFECGKGECGIARRQECSDGRESVLLAGGDTGGTEPDRASFR